MEENKVSGIIKSVNGDGVLINDVWYNAIGNAIQYVKPELKGKKAEITIAEKNKFNYIKITSFTPGDSKAAAVTSAPGLKYCSDGMPMDFKLRSMAISYAKDLVVAESIEESAMIEVAEGIFNYITTGKRLV